MQEELSLRILFVCTGNICRSPIAERLAAVEAVRQKIPNVNAASAGTRAVVGHPIHDDAASVLAELGGDPSGFAARQFRPKLAMESDLILTMTKAHRDDVLRCVPRLIGRTFTIAEAAQLVSEFKAGSIAELAECRPFLAGRRLSDVPDPIGKEAEFFARVGAQIAELLAPVMELARSAAAAPDE